MGKRKRLRFISKTPLGGSFEFLTQDELDYFERSLKKYKVKYEFEHPADRTILENLLVNQVLVYRYSKWLARGTDYDGNPIDTDRVTRNIISHQQEIQNLMNLLGISRDKRATNLSAQEVILKIMRKAKEYGLHKNKVAWEFLVSSYRIRDVLNTYKRMNEAERRRFGYTETEVIEKIKEIMKPLEEMEEKFKQERNLWIADIKGEET